jgi:hypothetical protein
VFADGRRGWRLTLSGACATPAIRVTPDDPLGCKALLEGRSRRKRCDRSSNPMNGFAVAILRGTRPAGGERPAAARSPPSPHCRAAIMPTTQNPAKLAGPNPQPKAEGIRPFTQADIDLVTEELGAEVRPCGAVRRRRACGHRSGWRSSGVTSTGQAGVVLVERTCAYGVTKSYAKTARRRRRVPLSVRALEALDAVPRRLDVRLVFPGSVGGVIDLKNFRCSQWKPALDAAGVPPRRIYDMRQAFATRGYRSSTSAATGHIRGDDRQHLRPPGSRHGRVSAGAF